MLPRVYADRTEAGSALAAAIAKRRLQSPVLVLGLPRGGVPVAYGVARQLGAPLDVMLVRKVGMPGQRELAIGAIASGNVTVRSESISRLIGHRNAVFETLVEQERAELERRERVYRANLPPLDLQGQTVILVDDGLATGSTMLAAVQAAKQAGASWVVAAAPVASHKAVTLVQREADEVLILQVSRYLSSIGEYYENFDQLQDAEVCRLLQGARLQVPSDSTHHRRVRTKSTDQVGGLN